ncbi:EXS family-domain-containing protein [Morchella snyderi]|nr:EXS family-domain-containing protein [Morchella snyderi]
MEEEFQRTAESLSVHLPLPYRVILIFIIGIWLFGLNLHYFSIIRIEAGPMLRYTRSVNEPPLHSSVYQVALVLSALFGLNLAAFWTMTGGSEELVKAWEILPSMLFAAIVGIFLWPFGGWHKRGRWRFLRMLRRILIGGIHPDLRFADILLADALTSYAKVLGDFAVCICMFTSGHSSTNTSPNRACGGVYLVPCVMALPYLIRLRQCLTEYVRARRKGVTERRVHLYNSAKYASAFPVIVCSALQREYDPDVPHMFQKSTLSSMWLCAVVFNSCFSFYWDVTKDWDLTLFSSKRFSEDYPWALRANRHFVAVGFYYSAIIVDILLRATWSFKLSPHLDYINEMEGGIFILELLEVFRRWVWTFFRVEKEWVHSRAGGGLGFLENGEGMQLQEFGSKLVED